MKAEVIETDANSYTVIINGLFADRLTRDEALGAIASALFSDHRPIFVRTYEEWFRWNERFSISGITEPTALLEHKPNH